MTSASAEGGMPVATSGVTTPSSPNALLLLRRLSSSRCLPRRSPSASGASLAPSAVLPVEIRLRSPDAQPMNEATPACSELWLTARLVLVAKRCTPNTSVVTANPPAELPAAALAPPADPMAPPAAPPEAAPTAAPPAAAAPATEVTPAVAVAVAVVTVAAVIEAVVVMVAVATLAPTEAATEAETVLATDVATVATTTAVRAVPTEVGV